MRIAGLIVGVALIAGCTTGGSGQPGSGDRTALIARIDSIIEGPIGEGKLAGATVAVVKGSDTVLVRGYGQASLELGVPTPANGVYEIGSVTKQFTATAILQLVEQGKLDLDADMRRYLPDFDTRGRVVPLRRLMDHTSGIRSYTEMRFFGDIATQALPRDTLVTAIEREPFDFEPGEELIYNNSAYFLLGLIIEKASGQSYADYVAEHLFVPAGMTHSYYCSERAVQPEKVQGYEVDSTGLVQKSFLSHVWPYAAGSLCASALDLVAWNQALHGGRMLQPDSYAELTTPGTLADGTPVRYAKGIVPVPLLGHRAYEHGGGIFGFLSENMYFPDDSLSIVVLFNTAGPASPSDAAMAIAELLLGKPEEKEVPYDGDLAAYTGTFAGRGRGRATELQISVEDGKLRVKRSPSDSGRVMRYLGEETFGVDNARYAFSRTGSAVTGVRLDAVGTVVRLTRK